MLHKVLDRMLGMCRSAWTCLIRSLQLCCLLLFCALLLLVRADGRSELLHTAAALQECAQLSLLLGVILPPCLEELHGSEEGNPPGSSGH